MQGLRLLVLSISLSLSASCLEAATVYYTESAVTLQLTIRSTSQAVRSEPDETGLIVEETQIESRRLGNTALLAEMARRSLIPSTKGHSLVAVWANWPDEKPFKGSAFRLFVRKIGAKQHALTKVPPEVLGISPEDWLHERNFLRRSGAIKAGVDDFEAYSKLNFQVVDAYGTLLGRDSGGGVFRAPTKSARLQYLPRPGNMSLEGTAAGGVCSGEVAFGQARFIAQTDFKPNALPQKTRPGGSYGYGSVSMMIRIDGRWLPPPPHVHYFCPLRTSLTLETEVAVPATEPGREIRRISTAEIALDDLLRGALQEQNVDDPTGWDFYLHARSDEYTSLKDFQLVLAHPDGRIFRLGDANLEHSYGQAEEARREYRNGAYVAGTFRTLAHLTHARSWRLPAGDSLYLLGTGAVASTSSYGPIPEANGSRDIQPISAEGRIFGTYSKTGESGLATMSFSIGAPLAQSEIPAGWSSLFPPYTPYWLSDIGPTRSSFIFSRARAEGR